MSRCGWYRFLCRSQPVTLVCTGALTNAALLVSLFPEILPMIEIVLMGGCLGTGNTGSVAEFNIQVRASLANF